MPALIPHGPSHDIFGGDPLPTIFAPNRRVFDYDDFAGWMVVNIGNGTGKLSWYLNSDVNGYGTLTPNSPYGANNVDRAHGVADIALAASVNGWFWLSLGNPITPPITGNIVPGLGVYTFEWRFAVEPQYVATVNDSLIFFGLANCYLGGGVYSTATEGLMWVTWPANSLNTWNLYSSCLLPTGSPQATTQALPNYVIPGSFHKYRLTSNAAWTSWQAYIDDVPVGTPITTNIPTGKLLPFFNVNGQSGLTIHHVYLDYFWHDYQYAR